MTSRGRGGGGDPAAEAVTGFLGERTRHLPNDRSVDAMLDHPWIIRGSSVDHPCGGWGGEGGGEERQAESRSSDGTTASQLEFLFRSRAISRAYARLRHVNGSDARGALTHTTHTAGRAAEDWRDGTPRDAEPRAHAIAASRRGARAKRGTEHGAMFTLHRERNAHDVRSIYVLSIFIFFVEKQRK